VQLGKKAREYVTCLDTEVGRLERELPYRMGKRTGYLLVGEECVNTSSREKRKPSWVVNWAY
jgi:hypothetical protein